MKNILIWIGFDIFLSLMQGIDQVYEKTWTSKTMLSTKLSHFNTISWNEFGTHQVVLQYITLTTHHNMDEIFNLNLSISLIIFHNNVIFSSSMSNNWRNDFLLTQFYRM